MTLRHMFSNIPTLAQILHVVTLFGEKGAREEREREPSDPFPARAVERLLHNPVKIIPPKNRDLV